ncbi:MAG: alkaline phytoceramidase [Betaproteobacteria bacterium]|nr:alkaline phytoceramidase [Betaproteobacteria bacterium]
MSAILPVAPALRWRLAVLAAVALAATVAMLAQDPIPQPESFHNFADARTLFGVPNFWNVASNLVFLATGAHGLAEYARCRPVLDPPLRPAYLTVYIGSLLICLGSGWYHLAPDTPRLTWDRLPIAMTFMGVFAVVVGEYLGPRWGRHLLAPLLAAGLLSVAHWHFSEAVGRGDLRYYALVQVVPLLLVPLILILFRPVASLNAQSGPLPAAYLWGVVMLYGVAKASEVYDPELLQITGLSGHTLKHLFAGTGVWLFVLAMRRKRLRQATISA